MKLSMIFGAMCFLIAATLPRNEQACEQTTED